MGLMDKLTAGIERVAEGADKAIDKGRAKVGEMQIELQMDGLAKKLGYLVFDFYRGREVDQASRQKLLDELGQLEDKLFQARAEAAAKAEAEAAYKAQQSAQAASPAGTAQYTPPAEGATAPAGTAASADSAAAPSTDATPTADGPLPEDKAPDGD